jgi:hypothetical protein
MSIGDLLPDHIRKQFAADSIKIGAVIRCHVKFTRPPKTKRFIIAGIANDLERVAVVCINSEINFNVIGSPELQALQYKVESAGTDYLDHDSFIDCSQLNVMEVKELTRNILHDSTVVLGDLSGADLAAVKTHLKNAKTISIRMKKEFHLI